VSVSVSGVYSCIDCIGAPISPAVPAARVLAG
jgi:hypothetical protein